LNLPDRDGFSMFAELRERNPAVSVVVLSAAQDRANVVKALDLGAMGYIPKSARNEVMLSALQLVFAGGHIYPPGNSGARALVTPCSAICRRQSNRVACGSRLDRSSARCARADDAR